MEAAAQKQGIGGGSFAEVHGDGAILECAFDVEVFGIEAAVAESGVLAGEGEGEGAAAIVLIGEPASGMVRELDHELLVAIEEYALPGIRT